MSSSSGAHSDSLSLFFFCVCVPGRCFILGIFSLARVKSDDVVEEEEHGG